MDENPYKPPDGEGSYVANRFRIGRVLLAVSVVTLFMLAPFIWLGLREWNARERARNNMQQLKMALEAYHDRYRQTVGPAADTDDRSR